MSFIQDIFSIFKKRDILFLESYNESEDIYTFLFEKDEDLTWKAGQHGLFSIIHKKINNPIRPFTVASAPTEKVIRLTMRIGNNPSEFKKAMLELKKGMKIKMIGPVGGFYLKDNSPALLIAGGVGITPFRSILKQIEAEVHAGSKQIHLLYLDSNKSYIFKDELDNVDNKTLANINITYLDSRDSLLEEIDKFKSIYNNGGKYFISGPKSMVESISSYLQKNNVSNKNIKKGSFIGYE